MKRNISTRQIFRHAIQLMSFFLFPGLFIMAYSSIKSVITAIINGTFSFSSLSGDVAVMIAVIPITVLLGRFFCGFICTFGAMGDFFVLFIRIYLEKAS